MQLVIDDDNASAKSRITAIRAAMMLTRSMELWRTDKDIETVVIILAVISITSEKLTRVEMEAKYNNLATFLPFDQLQGCNIASIAEATGLNRETVRRRVSKLVDSGYLIRTQHREIALAPAKANQAAALDLVRKQLEAFVRFANESLRDGVLRACE